MVYGIVKQSGGDNVVESRPGSGSTFHIYLPGASGPVESLQAKSRPGDLPRGTETILLVEDDRGVRVFVRKTLERQGYTVLETQHSVEAEEFVKQQARAIDLLVTDMIMPQMNGREVAERLKRASPGMKVLFMSGYEDSQLTQRGATEHGIVFLPKPFTPAALTLKVRELLDSTP
jgi:hypothetical protein